MAAITGPAVWGNWTVHYDATSSVTTASGCTWDYWNTAYADTGTTATCVTNAVVWNEWVAAGTVFTVRPYIPVQESPEAVAARELRRQQAQVADEQRRARHAVAKTRAKALLLSVLTQEQTADLAENGGFFVFGRSGKLYRIYDGYAGNVDEIAPDGRVTDRFCCHPQGFVPDEDAMLSQMLMLMNREDEFLRMANRQTVRRRRDADRLASLAQMAMARQPQGIALSH